MREGKAPMVLVVEDEPPIAQLIETVLEVAGFRCARAGCLADADALLAAERIEGITLDLALPGTHALPWLERLAVSDPKLAAHTVVVTGAVLDDEMSARIAACGAGIVQKPFELRALRSAVRRQIGHAAEGAPGTAIP